MDTLYVKVWRTAKDGKVRETHMAADGQVRFLDEPFNIGLAKLMAPRDPDGPTEETINCRCEMEQVLFSDLGVGDQALLRRKRPELFKPKEEPKKPRTELKPYEVGRLNKDTHKLFAGPFTWGPWLNLRFMVLNRSHVRVRLSFHTISDIPSAFDAEIMYTNTNQKIVRERHGNPSQVEFVTGDLSDDVVREPRVRLRSYSQGQDILIVVTQSLVDTSE